MKVLVAHPGTQHSFHLACALNEKNYLFKFVTSIAISESSFWRRLFGARIARRVAKGIDGDKLKSYPAMVILEYFLKLLGRKEEEIYFMRNLRFQQKVIKNDIQYAEVVIGFDTSSWLLAKYCQENNKVFILDVSIGHPVSKEKIFSDLRKRFPNWIDVAVPKKKAHIAFEQEEFKLATAVVVPSSFVKRTLIENGVDADKIFINPFGSSVSNCRIEEKNENREQVRFLFFGALSARKGLPLLLQAWRLLKDTNRAILIVAGYGQIPEGEKIPGNVKVLGPIKPNDRASLYGNADVFVFPSYFEGFAQVLIEAAGSGLPIISTSNSGAEDIIKDGYNGFIIKPGDVDTLTSKISYFINHPTEIALMKEKVKERIDYFSWSAYGDRWINILDTVDKFSK